MNRVAAVNVLKIAVLLLPGGMLITASYWTYKKVRQYIANKRRNNEKKE